MQINSLSELNILARAVVPECCRALILFSQLYLKRVVTSFLEAFWLVSNIIYGSCFILRTPRTFKLLYSLLCFLAKSLGARLPSS